MDEIISEIVKKVIDETQNCKVKLILETSTKTKNGNDIFHDIPTFGKLKIYLQEHLTTFKNSLLSRAYLYIINKENKFLQKSFSFCVVAQLYAPLNLQFRACCDLPCLSLLVPFVLALSRRILLFELVSVHNTCIFFSIPALLRQQA
jgi:hypothetical protein